MKRNLALWHEHKYYIQVTDWLSDKQFQYRKFMIKDKIENDHIIDFFESTVTFGHETKYNNLVNKCARLNYDFQLYTNQLMFYLYCETLDKLS